MKSLVIIVMFPFLFLAPARAQKSGSVEKADAFYENLGYSKAIALYEAGELTLESMERIANSYRLNHDTWNAEKWFARIVLSDCNPVNYLYYAQALQSNGNPEEARMYYLKYDNAVGNKGDQRGSRFAAAIDRMKEVEGTQDIELKNIREINSNKLDFSPAFYQNGIVFVSNRETDPHSNAGEDAWTGDDFTGLYYAALNAKGIPSPPQNFSQELNSRFHEGSLSFSRDGKQVFFTANKEKNNGGLLKKLTGDGARNLGICRSEWTGSFWLEAEPVDLSGSSCNDAHPSLSSNGLELYFASDRPGGYGGMDLYVSRFSRGLWGTPLNLGSGVNTSGNEVFPFIHDDGTLYFASDGWGGPGGLDIFKSERTAENIWLPAVILGPPVNSPKDDFGYILNKSGTEGWLTSARDGGLGKDDIYHFMISSTQETGKENVTPLTVYAYDETTGSRLGDVKITIFTAEQDGSYIGFEGDQQLRLVPDAVTGEFALHRQKRDPFGSYNGINETCETGSGQLELLLRNGRSYLIRAEKPGFQEANHKILPDNLKKELGIPMLPVRSTMLQGTLTDRETNEALPGARVTILNMCSGTLYSVTTDEEGKYNVVLTDRCDFVISGDKANYMTGNVLVSSAGNLPGNNGTDPAGMRQDLSLLPVNGAIKEETGGPVTMSEILETGIIIGLENIYYDFNDDQLRPEARQELDRVAAFLSRHPELSIELRSHTDSRGNDDYNRELSVKRAAKARTYILERGIAANRITAAGLGEDQLVNNCDDGVTCDEKSHQQNRRTEIKVFREN